MATFIPRLVTSSGSMIIPSLSLGKYVSTSAGLYSSAQSVLNFVGAIFDFGGGNITTTGTIQASTGIFNGIQYNSVSASSVSSNIFYRTVIPLTLSGATAVLEPTNGSIWTTTGSGSIMLCPATGYTGATITVICSSIPFSQDVDFIQGDTIYNSSIPSLLNPGHRADFISDGRKWSAAVSLL